MLRRVNDGQQEDEMTTWSYMSERIPEERTGPFLADRGRQGWELCAVRTIDDRTVELYFKRPNQ